MAARYAFYFAPAPHTPLWRFGSSWLGFDAASGEAVAPAGVGEVDPDTQGRITQTPRRYGFHATLKAPFTLAEGRTERDLNHMARDFTRERRSFSLPPLQLTELGDFLALCPQIDCPPLTALAEACVRAFDPLRAPLGAEERARRGPERLTPRQRELLDQWGYPFVLDQFRFHMSLTGALEATERRRVMAALEPVLATVCTHPVAVDALCVFRQAEPRARFRIIGRHALPVG